MNVKDIVTRYLEANGYAGLGGYGCGCGLDDLMPCEGPCEGCMAAYKAVCGHCGAFAYYVPGEPFGECPECGEAME